MANIEGTTNSNFDATVTSGIILSATLHIPGSGTPDTPLDFTDTAVTVLKLPAGLSEIRLAISFAPGDPDSTIGVGAVRSGVVTAPNPPGSIINDGTPAGVITMVGA